MTATGSAIHEFTSASSLSGNDVFVIDTPTGGSYTTKSATADVASQYAFDYIRAHTVQGSNMTISYSGGSWTFSSSGGGGGTASSNGIINGECLIAQGFNTSISGSPQFGPVDRIAVWASGTAITAGSIVQNTSGSVGQGLSVGVTNATITGTGIVYARYRMESRDSIRYKNKSCSFSCRVYQNTGGAITYTITIRKANAVNTFTAVTDISSGSASVSNTTDTLIKLENVSMGDCSNGIEIEVKGACGAVTTKNFEFGEFIFDVGATAPTFYYRDAEDILPRCYRYCWSPQQTEAYNIYPSLGVKTATKTLDMLTIFSVPMFTTPTLYQAGSTTWNDSDHPSGNQCSFYDNNAANWLTITGALTISLVDTGPALVKFRMTAGTSFSGTNGDNGNLFIGNACKFVFRAEI